jgi:hypothetical protein
MQIKEILRHPLKANARRVRSSSKWHPWRYPGPPERAPSFAVLEALAPVRLRRQDVRAAELTQHSQWQTSAGRMSWGGSMLHNPAQQLA